MYNYVCVRVTLIPYLDTISAIQRSLRRLLQELLKRTPAKSGRWNVEQQELQWKSEHRKYSGLRKRLCLYCEEKEGGEREGECVIGSRETG